MTERQAAKKIDRAHKRYVRARNKADEAYAELERVVREVQADAQKRRNA